MKIKIYSNLPFLSHLISENIVMDLNSSVEVSYKDVEGCVLWYGHDVTILSLYIKALSPLKVECKLDERLSADDLVLELGSKTLSKMTVNLTCDSPGLDVSIHGELQPLGVAVVSEKLVLVKKNRLVCKSTSSLDCQLLVWTLQQQGISVVLEEDENYLFDDNCDLFLADSAMVNVLPKERMRLMVGCDDVDLAAPLVKRLKEAGYQVEKCADIDAEEMQNENLPIGIASAWFNDGGSFAELMDLRSIVGQHVRDLGIDTSKYPVIVNDEYTGGLEVAISLPLASCLDVSYRPYGVGFPQAYSVTIKTDDSAACAPLIESLKDVGFAPLTIEDDLDCDERLDGFRVRCNKDNLPVEIYSQLVGIMRKSISEIVPEQDFDISTYEWVVGNDREIVLYVPMVGVADGTLKQEIVAPARFVCRVHCAKPDEWNDVVEKLQGFSFKNAVDIVVWDVDSAEIKFGGAPQSLIDEVAAAINTAEDVQPHCECVWSKSDNDIWIYLPVRKNLAETLADSATDEEFKLFGSTVLKATDLVYKECDSRELRLGDVVLQRSSVIDKRLVPAPEQFEHFCIDTTTAATLEHVAWSVKLREPCLLEGVTSTSKTSSILFLASNLGQPVLRLNLNGHTDTSELIGRYSPAENGDGWQWLDGCIVQAMRNGYWLILDELNLAETQIVERLNSVLERNGSLLLSEHNNSVIGAGGHPVHPDFRIFATMNPPDYAGRITLSPAYRDRWQGYRFIPAPSKNDYLQMLHFWITGIQPNIGSGRYLFRGEQQNAVFANMAHMVETTDLLDKLASFHALMERAAIGAGGQASLGSDNREHYVFTRRGLLQMMEFMTKRLECQEGEVFKPVLLQALKRYYIDKLHPGSDVQVANRLLEAAGFDGAFWGVS